MTFSQRVFLKGSRDVTLNKEDSLTVRHRHKGTLMEFTELLSAINESPSRTKQPATKFVAGPIVFGLFLSGCFAGVLLTPDESGRITFAVLSACFLVPFLWSIHRMWSEAYDFLVFFNRFSGQPVFTLFYNQPSEQEFGSFVAELQKRLKQTHAAFSTGEATSVPTQILGFARLRDEGILTPQEFDVIKQRLLASINEPPRRVGF